MRTFLAVVRQRTTPSRWLTVPSLTVWVPCTEETGRWRSLMVSLGGVHLFLYDAILTVLLVNNRDLTVQSLTDRCLQAMA